MKKLFMCALFFTFASALFAAEKEADVSFAKEGGKVEYKLTVRKPFKINTKAPFKFNLKKKDTVVRKVAFKEFSSSKEGVYLYNSTEGESHMHYWFIACKYKDGKQVACKTFTGKHEIK